MLRRCVPPQRGRSCIMLPFVRVLLILRDACKYGVHLKVIVEICIIVVPSLTRKTDASSSSGAIKPICLLCSCNK
jgi:hypothetical protein